MIKKMLFLSLLICNFVVNAQFYASFGSQEFKEKCISYLEKTPYTIPVHCSISTRRTKKIETTFKNNALHINFHLDVVETCNNDELIFFILSLYLGQNAYFMKMDPRQNWREVLKGSTICGIPAIANVLLTAKLIEKFYKNRRPTFVYLLGYGITVTSKVYNLIFWGHMAYWSTFLFCSLKYAQHYIEKGDLLASNLIGLDIALNALDKVRNLPREYDNIFTKYFTSYDENYQQRYDNLMNTRK